ncbi:MAG: hypothetical protein V3V76_00725 [Candidatus Adiutricales bacterium]
MNEASSMEARSRYDCSGRWFKGNLHMHTDRSDGGFSPLDAATFYAERGYDFISITDHRRPFNEVEMEEKLPLLVLDGIELDGVDENDSFYHVICVGGVHGITPNMTLLEALEKARSQGSILIWGHPHWSGNTVKDGMRHGFHGLEIFNYSCEVALGKGSGAFHWDWLLEYQPDLLGFATDDNHYVDGYPPQVGGWIMVNAPDLSSEAILNSIRKGNFYSSSGPDFKSIHIEQGNRVVAETSPIDHARLVGPAKKGKWKAAAAESGMIKTNFRIPDDWAFARLEIEDANGKKAWSNPLVVNKD